MKEKQKMQNDPVFGIVPKYYLSSDPLFEGGKNMLTINREKSSSYFSNNSATCRDEKISAIVHRQYKA